MVLRYTVFMKIAVTSRFIKQDFGGGYYYVNNANVRMFNDNGVILIPVTSIIEKDFILKTCDGLFVPGGCDIDPKNYNEEIAGSIEPIDFIDDLDIFYIKEFYKANKPILGICRGIQIINVCFGGTLYQDIKEHQNVFHDVSVDKDSFVYDLYKKETISVNSYHHQVIKQIGNGLRPVAYSRDGYIEAIQGENIYAVQWHPELYMGDEFINYFIKNIF